jgi:uncharacterized protein YndB with AHSA1/START domain
MTHEIKISRLIDAPRERVFDAWTNPSSLNAWWGPQGFTNTTESIDVRPGGVWQFVMHSPDGTDYPNRITFEEIVRPERITYLHGEDEGKPRDFNTTVTFEDAGGRTLLTMNMVFANEKLRHEALGFGAIEGGHSTIDKLTEFVAAAGGQPSLVISRIFHAPVERVWRAWTETEQIKQWWGPEHFTAPVAKIDFREGGKYHYAMRDPDGNDYWSTGKFVEIVPHQRIVYTDSFADAEGNVIPATTFGMGDDYPDVTTATVTFEDIGEGRTRLTLVGEAPNGEMLEMARSGWSTSMDKLAKVVAQG